MLDLVALVERAVLLARLARTRRCCLAVLAGPAVMPVRLVRARWVLAARMEHSPRAMAERAALVAPAAWAAMLELAALEELAVPGLAATVVWA